MSGAMRKMGVYLGLLEDTERYEEYDDDPGADPRRDAHPGAGDHAPAPHGATRMDARVPARAASVASLSERRRTTPGAPATGPAAGPVVAELSRITTLHPSTYNEARVVGENFRDGIPVIMNLSEMDDTDAKRLVDFAAGLVFAVRGSIERVTNKVFLLSPPNVSVTAEDKQRIAEGGFFNQS